MAENVETTILDVKLDAGTVAKDLNDLVRQIAAMRDRQKELNKKIKEGKDVDGKYAEELIRVKDNLSWAEKQAKGLSATTKLLSADTKEATGSLNEERQKLADMHKAYDQLSKAQRESEGGKAFLAAIKEQSDAVKELEAETGRAQRNVGNYPKLLTAIVPQLDGITAKIDGIQDLIKDAGKTAPKAMTNIAGGFKTAAKAAWSFVTTPIGAFLTALLVVVKGAQVVFGKLADAFKKNDDAGTNLQRLFASFQPVLTLVNKLFDGLATILGKVAGGLADIIAYFSGGAKEAQALVTSIDSLQETERKYAVDSAERNKEIARLRAEAAAAGSNTERKKLLEEAIRLEEQNLEDEKTIASERLRILEQTAEQEVDTSGETKDKIANARAALYQAEEKYYTGVRKLRKELTTIDEQAAAAAVKATAAQADNANKIAQEVEDFTLSLIKDEDARALAQRRIEGEREIEALKVRLQTEANLTAESRAQLSALIIAKQEALEDELADMAEASAAKRTEEDYQREQERAQRILQYRLELAEEGSTEELDAQKELLQLQMEQELANTQLTEEEKYLIREAFTRKAEELDEEYNERLKRQAEDAREAYKGALLDTGKQAARTFGQMSNLLKAYGEQNDEAAAASKAFGIAQIIADQAMSIANTAKAITSAVMGATDAAAAGGPLAPFLIGGYIAAMVGAVLGALGGVAGSFVQAKQVINSDAGSFEGGGVIKGTSYTGDKLIAHVNSAEGIYNPHQANNLLYEIAQNPMRGGLDYGRLADAMASALREMPAPVMDYAEFKTFEGQVATYNELTKI